MAELLAADEELHCAPSAKEGGRAETGEGMNSSETGKGLGTSPVRFSRTAAESTWTRNAVTFNSGKVQRGADWMKQNYIFTSRNAFGGGLKAYLCKQGSFPMALELRSL